MARSRSSRPADTDHTGPKSSGDALSEPDAEHAADAAGDATPDAADPSLPDDADAVDAAAGTESAIADPALDDPSGAEIQAGSSPQPEWSVQLELLRAELEQIGDPDARLQDLNRRVNEAVAQLKDVIDRSERAIVAMRRDVRAEQEASLKAHDRRRAILAEIAKIEKQQS
jgi:hypothetical protein